MSRQLAVLASLALLAGCSPAPAPPPAEEMAPPPPSRADIAMSAAPAAISANATLMDTDSTGAMIELRAGTNGWVCMADIDPNAPGDGPACLDGAWQAWAAAWSNKTAPAVKGVGIAYMLQGGKGASNTDPYATAPAEGEVWIDDGPHLMVIVPNPAMLEAFPTDPNNGGPYVMWKGTPYVHLMVPTSAAASGAM